ncbi:MAG TPA: FtsX-like permease family protein, partial [Pseudomonadales bacterium]|nr:FtsX-like permease family protein [Pseudomonadales bacterium]
DIAILRTLGASPAAIMGVFVVQGTLIGLTGAAIGGLAGVLLSLGITDAVALLERVLGVQFLKAEVYPVSYLPSALAWWDVAQVCGVALAMSFVATLYPSWRAARMQPAEVLRYE